MGFRAMPAAGCKFTTTSKHRTNTIIRSAATILSLLEEGTFDYGSIFTDQAPLHDFDFTTGLISENGTST